VALVYLVDDDPLVLTSLHMLLEMETAHRVRDFEDPKAALAALDKDKPDVILTDLTMPHMSGIEFLRQARKIRPEATSILLTAYADKDAAIRAINDAGVFQIVEKPWDNDELLAAVGHAAERVELQERLIASERLAAVGRLASGIAHEIGNQLSLLGFAELIAERYSHDPEAQALTDPLLAARRRLGSMVASIKEFVRGQNAPTYERQPQPLVPVVDETLSILRFEPAMKLRKLEKRPWDVEVRANINAERMLQVVLNLLRNAIQATREDGKIRIGVSRRGDEAILEIEDDGMGIPAELQEKIWEPFFSTKGDGGTGLGLGICRRLVEEHGGRITLRSSPGEGATFTVILPVSGP
jgi:signal transduction histidine kinase